MRVLLPLLLPVSAPTASATAGLDLAAAAREQVGVTALYDRSYQTLAYPGGDVAPDRGVCTDQMAGHCRYLRAR